MGETRTLSISSNQFFPDHDRFSDQPYRHQAATIKIDKDDAIVEIDYRTEKDEVGTVHKQECYLYLKLPHASLIDLLRFISSRKAARSGEQSHIDISVKEGIVRNSRTSQGLYHSNSESETQINVVRLCSFDDRLVLETFSDGNPVVPYYKIEHNNEPQDRENLEQLRNYSANLLEDLAPDKEDTARIADIPGDVESHLRSIKWGNEVLEHTEDGDQCLQADLLHPAMTSYVHAIEWAIIAYLEDERCTDVVKKEKDGESYYFHELVDEVSDVLNQVTESKLSNMNSEERRWAAHHKSGEPLQIEIESMRERLNSLLKQLFK